VTYTLRAVRTILIFASNRRAHMSEDSRAPLHTTDGNGKIPEVGDLRKAGARAVYYHYECSNPSCHDAVVLDVRTSGDRPSPCCTSCGIRLEWSASTPCDASGRASSPWMLAPRLRMTPPEGGDTDTNTEACRAPR
jgi:hypothetical protein